MSGNKHQSRENRRSPVAVGNRKPKTPKAGKNKPMSNGLQEIIPDAKMRGRSTSLDKGEVLKINLQTVRKLDKSVARIESTVPQVVLYQYETSSDTWERTSVEGTLFVCERESLPRFGFVVLNKLHSGNTMEAITPGMEFRVQEPFVLFKNASKIFGLCFQEVSVCQGVGKLLNRLSHSPELGPIVSGHSSIVPRRSASALTIGSAIPDQQYPKVDVLEMIETAYLGQTFSDGTSSPDSVTSDPISFSTTGATTVAVSTVDHRDISHHPTQHYTNTSLSKSVPRGSFPKDVPGVRVTSKTRAVSVSPKKRTHASKSDQVQKGQMQHATSFDNGQSGIGTSPNVSRSNQSSNQARSFDHGTGIVRQLFSQSEQNGNQNQLSKSMNAYSSSGQSGNAVPLRAISLDEVEKQMTAEVVSPSSDIPFSLLNTPTNSKPHNTPSEQMQQNVLLQPSVFASTAAPSPSKLHTAVAESHTQPLAISVKPPTPITAQNFQLNRQGQAFTQNQSFPPIPPLMHSAGMRAPPITRSGKVTDEAPKRLHTGGGLMQTPPSVNQIPQRASSEPAFHTRSQAGIQPVLSPLPELLTTHNRTTSPTPISSTLMSPQQFKQEQTEPVTTETPHNASVGLTRDQLLQAFDYLLKHDEHFIDQLHTAYKQSLSLKQ